MPAAAARAASAGGREPSRASAADTAPCPGPSSTDDLIEAPGQEFFLKHFALYPSTKDFFE